MTKTDVTVSVDGGKEVYRAGEVVKGYWTIENDEPLKVKGINCYFYGATYVKWTETEAIRGSTVDRDYISHEKYNNTYINLFGRKPSEDGPNHVLEAGRHVYKFEFTVPNDKLPSSFEGIKGAVRYWLMVKIERPIWSDVIRHKCVTVLDDVDINFPFYAKPQEKRIKKQLSKALGFGDAGELTLYGRIDRAGYCPGERIAVAVTVKNETTKDLGRIKASLVQRVEYRANGETKYETTIIHTIQGEPLKQGETRNWKNQLLKIDAVPPSTRLRTCHCLIVDYYVKILVDVPLISGGDLVVTLPITIGTVPQGHVKRPNISTGASSGIQEIDARSAITYTKCNKGWSYFKRTAKSHIDFYTISYIPMCAYVPNFKFVDKTRTVVSATKTKPQTKAVAPSTTPAKQSTTAANTSLPNRTARVNTASGTFEARTTVRPSAPPLEHVDISAAPPTYDEAMSQSYNEQASEDDNTEGSEFSLVISFKETDTDKVKDTLVKSKNSLEKFEGEFSAISAKTVRIRGSWSTGMAVALLTFPSKQNAIDWLTFTPSISDPNWLESCTLTLVDCKEHFQDERTILILYDLNKKPNVDDNDFKEMTHITNEIIKPIRLANGGSTVASSVNHQSLRGKLVEDGHRFVITTWQSLKHFMGYPKHVPTDIYERFKELHGKCFNANFTVIYELQDLSVDNIGQKDED